jgi:hypothetical protein
MSQFCYIIDDQKGARWHLSDEGPQRMSTDLADRLDRDEFRHSEDRCIGSCVLHVFERVMPATDIVGAQSEACNQ